MRHFTHYWSYHDNEIDRIADGVTPLDYTVGSHFKARGAEIGHAVYVASIRQGRLYLFGKLVVGEWVDNDRQALMRLGYKVWTRPEHLIASRCTPVAAIELSAETAQSLSFVSKVGKTRLTFARSKFLDRQTLRGVRELTSEGAASFDEVLPEMTEFSADAPSA